MRPFKTEGIILRGKSFFENDRLLTFFSKDLGCLQILVSGANRASYKGKGRLDAFHLVRLVLTKGRSFFYMRQCDLVNPFSGIRSDFNKMALAFYFFDIVIKATSQEQPNVALYDLVEASLGTLESATDLSAERDAFHTGFLIEEGLLDKQRGLVTEQVFQQKFEEYTGKIVKRPNFV